jgi:hypothetical protein
VQKLRIDVQRFIEDAQAELLGIQREAENAFVMKLKPAVAKVALDKGHWTSPDVLKQLAAK